LTFNFDMLSFENIPDPGYFLMLSPKKWYLLAMIILIGTLGIYPFYLPEKEKAMADVAVWQNTEGNSSEFQIVQETTLLPLGPVSEEKNSQVAKRLRVIVTAYSSSPGETDGDPYITASGTLVRDGIVANNLLPFGTKVRLPEIFGNKVFVVEDRMNWRKGYYHVDVWFPSRQEALAFGSKLTEMEILNN